MIDPNPVEPLGVIGNISYDHAIYPDGRHYEFLGGAALHVALAAAQAGLQAAPIAVVGHDLAEVMDDPRLGLLGTDGIRVDQGRSCAFRMIYDQADKLSDISCDFGVGLDLTEHALGQLGGHKRYHVCCRRPLDVARVLNRLAELQLPFSLDFHIASARSLIADALLALPKARLVFLNVAEFDLLRRLIAPRRLEAVVVTDGLREARLLRFGEPVARITPQATKAIEVTNAGDILAGSFLAWHAFGLDDATALGRAVSAATKSVQDPPWLLVPR